MPINSYSRYFKCHHNEAMYHYLLLLSLSCICNLEARTINEIVQMRIVGGTPCTARMYPFIVAVRLEDPFA